MDNIKDNSKEEFKTALQIGTELETYTRNLLLFDKKNPLTVKKILEEIGLESNSAFVLIKNMLNSRYVALNKNLDKDIFYGILWFSVGAFLTYAKIGYIFWGAMVYGVYKFFVGIINRMPLITDSLVKDDASTLHESSDYYYELMAKQSNKELSLIVTTKRNDYNEAAVVASKIELKRRGVNYRDLVSSEALSEEDEKERIKTLFQENFGNRKITLNDLKLN